MAKTMTISTAYHNSFRNSDMFISPELMKKEVERRMLEDLSKFILDNKDTLPLEYKENEGMFYKEHRITLTLIDSKYLKELEYKAKQFDKTNGGNQDEI